MIYFFSFLRLEYAVKVYCVFNVYHVNNWWVNIITGSTTCYYCVCIVTILEFAAKYFITKKW